MSSFEMVLCQHHDIPSSNDIRRCRLQQQQTALLPQQQARPVQAFGAAASLLTGSTAGHASSAAVAQPSAARQAASRHLSPARRSRQEPDGAVNLWPESQWPSRCINVEILDSFHGWPHLHRSRTGKKWSMLTGSVALETMPESNPCRHFAWHWRACVVCTGVRLQRRRQSSPRRNGRRGAWRPSCRRCGRSSRLPQADSRTKDPWRPQQPSDRQQRQVRQLQARS
jgi:hypothetical protein